jgi:uncharacterized protein (TIGR02271 family)
MKNTVVGLFEDRTEAQRAQSEIIGLDIPTGDTKVFDQLASQEAGSTTGESDQSWWESFKEAFGFGSSDDQSYYEEGVRRGGILLSVRAEDHLTDRVAEIMSEHGAIDIDERAELWRSSGWTPQSMTRSTGAATSAAPGSLSGSGTLTDRERTGAGTSGAAAQEGATMPVIEEKLRVGKREVRRGGVRIYRQVTEQPVEETVRLRDEAVRVERQPVDRPVTADTGLFQNETIEMTEIGEEPVVSKQARVVEEVTLRKDVQEHDETIRDTVRRSDVRVEQSPAGQAMGQSAWDDTEARTHWSTTYGSSGMGYDQYDPAYRFGSQLGGGRNIESSDWTQLEPEARRSWEVEHQGTWEQFKDAVRYSWERAKQKASPSTQRRAA